MHNNHVYHFDGVYVHATMKADSGNTLHHNTVVDMEPSGEDTHHSTGHMQEEAVEGADMDSMGRGTVGNLPHPPKS